MFAPGGNQGIETQPPGHPARILIGDLAPPRYTLPMLSTFCTRTIMARRCCCWLFIFGVLMLTSCQRAQRFSAPAKPPPAEANEKHRDETKYLYRLSWVEPRETRDVPILFVPDTSPEWKHLPAFWTNYPPIPLNLAQEPLPALTAIVVSDQIQAIKIKVPLGLPDPTEYFPKSNPPTLGKWRLGKELFQERQLQGEQGPYSCATCHKPEFGFAERASISERGRYNTLSLINVAYNRRQFWDGRVETLEETLVRSLIDERAEDPKRSEKALQHHNWGGFVRALAATKRYNEEFQRVFGLGPKDDPTQDAVAQALATYMRTILSGNSLYDCANQIRTEKNARALTTEHFLGLLGKKDENGKALAMLQDEPAKELAEADLKVIATGYELFKDTARCVRCHTGPLFTDHDYHNVGYEDTKEAQPDIGKETGRAVRVPVGLKESRLIGAFRTPSLRNLAHTGPYFHNGTHFTLDEVVEFYDKKVLWTRHLAKALKDGDEARELKLTPAEKDALVMFLRALEGTPVDPIVMKLER
jgi:cytochrome c peroxidase